MKRRIALCGTSFLHVFKKREHIYEQVRMFYQFFTCLELPFRSHKEKQTGNKKVRRTTNKAAYQIIAIVFMTNKLSRKERIQKTLIHLR